MHVSELSWKHIDHPSEVVEVGQEVTVEVLSVELDRERVSLSLKATQEDPWQAFARTHQIGQIVPGKVTKLVPFGAFVRVEEGIEGLVHVSELAERHVEIPEQVVQVNDDVMVKIIDIDLERRRISLSLKQANEGVDATADDFDPTLYGMAASYDDQGNYLYPEGFDPETGEWLEGYDEQRAAWEHQYAEAHARWEAHKQQVEDAETAGAAAAAPPASYSSSSTETVRRPCRPHPRVRWPPTRRCRRCGRSSPAQPAATAEFATRPHGRRRTLSTGASDQRVRLSSCRTLRAVIRVGLTGGIASGKSLVAEELAKRGAVVIDADVLAREVVEPGTPGLAAIVARFGDEVLTDGRLDRARLGALVFADPDARRDLERIVHPAVRARAAELERAAGHPTAVVVHVIPLLVETGQTGGSTSSWSSTSTPRPSCARLLRRDGLTEAEADRRIAAQASPSSAGWPPPTWSSTTSGSVDPTQSQIRPICGTH